jgi:glucosamine 6-phosphate synthetase-like amidotransferase/phosphosugar isomerase protein
MSRVWDEGVNGIPFDAIDEYHELINNEKNINMCGLVGFSGKADTSVLKALHLLADNDSRGGHSTGMFANGKIYKTLDESMNILPMLESNDTGSVLIGHTRYGTHGANTTENAHPFQHKGIIGAHNGVLDNYEEVGKKYGIEKTAVDSEMIIKVLGEKRDASKLGLFGGTKAVLYTASDNKLYVYRHNNPLFYLRKEEGVYFSSLKDGLENIAGKNEKIKECKKDKLFIWENGELLQTINIKHKPIPATKVINTNWQSYGNHFATPSHSSIYEQANIFEQNDWDNYEEEDYAKAEHLQKISLKLQELEEHLDMDLDSRTALRSAITELDEMANEIYYSY